MKRLLVTAALLWTATIVRADGFSYSYTGVGSSDQTVTGSIQITANADGGGVYTITSLTGNQTGPGALGGSISESADDFLISSGSTGIFKFVLNGNTYALAFGGGVYGDGVGPAASVGTFEVRALPEAATISLLLTMAFGVWAFGRKLPLKRQL